LAGTAWLALPGWHWPADNKQPRASRRRSVDDSALSKDLEIRTGPTDNAALANCRDRERLRDHGSSAVAEPHLKSSAIKEIR
jgi:hypothetical protein